MNTPEPEELASLAEWEHASQLAELAIYSIARKHINCLDLHFLPYAIEMEFFLRSTPSHDTYSQRDRIVDDLTNMGFAVISELMSPMEGKDESWYSPDMKDYANLNITLANRRSS